MTFPALRRSVPEGSMYAGRFSFLSPGRFAFSLWLASLTIVGGFSGSAVATPSIVAVTTRADLTTFGTAALSGDG